MSCPPRNKSLGSYTNEVDAAKVYDRAAVKRKGIDAETNFPLTDYLDLLGELHTSTFVC